MSASSESSLTCFAPAKLNLLLHVIGRRADGYHLLQTVFRFLDWGDTVVLSVREDGAVVRKTALAGVPPEQDLVVRAARLLQSETGCRLGCEIAVAKRLPLGGGLGGGSSDAASTLIGLNRLWNLGLTRERLQSLGLQLGADVPVFVFGRSAFAEGVGERLRPVELAPAWYVVLQPPVSVPTAAVFAAPELTRDSKPIKMQGFSAGAGRNDLEAVVCRRHPEVARHLAWLRQFGAAAMTGSGACVFAAFETEQAAREVLSRLPGDMTGWAARGIDRHPLWEWLQ
jgi:4-diphosphocytidyl-2-C-methyl-D-erythritol kinase